MGSPEGAVHMVAARLGFEKAMVGTQRATPCPDCMDRLRKYYSHLAEGWFLARDWTEMEQPLFMLIFF